MKNTRRTKRKLTDMEHMIEQQIIALDMEALTNRMRRLELEDKVIALLNQLWDENGLKSSPRRTVKVY